MKQILLSILFVATFAAANAQCDELFISEYMEGFGNNKMIELYNPTNAAIDLADYTLVRFRNGATSPYNENGDPTWVDLTGMIQPYSTFVACLDKRDPAGTGQEAPIDAELMAIVDGLGVDGGGYFCPVYDVTSTLYFNGDDAVALYKGFDENVPSAGIIDIFGKIGEDPGTAWTDAAPSYTDADGGAYTSRNVNMVRKATILGGTSTNPSVFNAMIEWDSLPGQPVYTDIGMHDCDCAATSTENLVDDVTLNLFPNPILENQEMTILSDKEMTRIQVFNTLGQTVFAQDVVTTEFTLNFEGTPGLYLVKINHGDAEVSVRNIIKQ